MTVTPTLRSRNKKTELTRHEQVGLSADQLRWALRGMMLARALDDRLWLWSRQGKVHFVITSAGHEATQLACAMSLRVGHDYIVPYYRDMAFAMAVGQTPLEVMLHAMGKAGDPSSGARQMFGHYSSRRLRMVSGSSSVGSHPVHAVGLALGFRAKKETGIGVMTMFGEGATAEGAWHEAMNFAGIHQLGVVFICENNHYAISVPQEREIPVPEVATKAAGYGMAGITVDGNDLIATYEVVNVAMQRAREGGGPTLVECKTYRLKPHSNADDDSKYRSPQEVEEWRKKDPILRLQQYLYEQELMTEGEVAQLQEAVNQDIDQASDAASKIGSPPNDSIFEHLYAPEEA